MDTHKILENGKEDEVLKDKAESKDLLKLNL